MRTICLLILCGLLFNSSACGLKGPLYPNGQHLTKEQAADTKADSGEEKSKSDSSKQSNHHD